MTRKAQSVIFIFIIFCCFSCLPRRVTKTIRHVPASSTVTKINFGSCGNQKFPQPVLSTVAKGKPDIFIFLGDNIYSNTNWAPLWKWKYRMLGVKPEFRELKDSTAILATWDDHDYGYNDSGVEFSNKERSKKVFLKFWNEPENSERRKHDGIYTSYFFGQDDKKVHIIILDLRYFRSSTPLAVPGQHPNDYRPNDDSTVTILGKEQWEWLRTELLKPAAIKIIASSTQFGTDYNGYETWANFPFEQKKMINLIRSTKAKGVIFISGDVHYGEISCRMEPGLYPLYDITSSGLTEVAGHAEPNKFRVGEPARTVNFGELQIDWNKPGVEVSMSLKDIGGNERVKKVILLKELE